MTSRAVCEETNHQVRRADRELRGSWGSAHPNRDNRERSGGSARPHRRLQPVGQGGQHLVELGVSQGLALLGAPAPPQQPHLEVGQEELQDLRLLRETCDVNNNNDKDHAAG